MTTVQTNDSFPTFSLGELAEMRFSAELGITWTFMLPSFLYIYHIPSRSREHCHGFELTVKFQRCSPMHGSAQMEN